LFCNQTVVYRYSDTHIIALSSATLEWRECVRVSERVNDGVNEAIID